MAISPSFILLLFGLTIVSIGIGYIFMKVLGLTEATKTSKADRKIIEDLGTEKIEYSSEYFNRLTRPAIVGENLPTRSCDTCGAPLNPNDVFCSKCGEEIL